MHRLHDAAEHGVDDDFGALLREAGGVGYLLDELRLRKAAVCCCVVEQVRRGTLDYFFAYPEDYAQQRVEWVDGQFGQRPHHRAFEVIYVYSQADGTLDVNIRGARTAVEPLQGLFAATILKQPALPPDPADDRVYDLTPLLEPGFEFVYGSGSGIQDVVVTALRLASRVTTGDRLTLEADTVATPRRSTTCSRGWTRRDVSTCTASPRSSWRRR